MGYDFKLRDIEREPIPVPAAAQIAHGIPILPVARLAVMSPEDWEQFTVEWLTFLKNEGMYWRILRSAGSGDRGVDVVAFSSELGFARAWDSYQCKHYSQVLSPNDVCEEAAKIVYHSFKKHAPFDQACRVPRRHVFVSPKGVGLKAGRWLRNPEAFRCGFKERWQGCGPKVSGEPVPLRDKLLAYVDGFDFSIFDHRTGIELIEDHAKSPFHAARFGGGLPLRGSSPAPPTRPTENESVYLGKLLDAYGDHLGKPITSSDDIDRDPTLRDHYNRQRVLFYSAEALRNFARDRTPEGTFNSLQDDIYHGVVDAYEEEYESGLARVRATVGRAAAIDVGGNALVGVTQVTDKQGVCHQLANECVLTWVNQGRK